jgi:hypothetical protein
MLARPIDRRRVGIIGKIDVQRRREQKQLGLAGLPKHLRIVHGRDRNVFAVLRVVAVLPVYSFVKLEKIELAALAALQQISAQVALVCVGIDQFKALLYGRGAHQFGTIPIDAPLWFGEAMNIWFHPAMLTADASNEYHWNC